MIAIHQEFVRLFREHEDDILSTQVNDDDDNDEVVTRSPSSPNVNNPQPPNKCLISSTVKVFQHSLKEYYGLGCNS